MNQETVVPRRVGSETRIFGIKHVDEGQISTVKRFVCFCNIERTVLIQRVTTRSPKNRVFDTHSRGLPPLRPCRLHGKSN